MAEMDTSSGGGHKKGPGVKKSKKLSTRVDLTPMVDLGFLLITFFIFTTTMSRPTAMKLNLPKDVDNPEEQNKAKETGALTILLGKDNHVFYYEGQLAKDGSNWKSSNFNGEGNIRDVIINKKKDVIARHVHVQSCQEIWAENNNDQNSCRDRDLVVVIKPGEESTYKNVVDILDEMAINMVKRYALVDISEGETALIKATEAANPGNK
ncbi:MAG TPA: biopolymer transporter ExbD [Chitinophagaceae bacterium]